LATRRWFDAPGHVGRSCGLVDEHKVFGIHEALPGTPATAFRGDVRSVLFRRSQRLFFKPEPKSAQHAMKEREPGRHIKVALQLGLDFDEGAVGGGIYHADQRPGMRLKQERSTPTRWFRF